MHPRFRVSPRLPCRSCSTALLLLLAAAPLGATEIPWGDTLTVYDDYAGVVSVDVADVDRDGRLDLVAAAPNAIVFAWFRNLGNGVFFPKVVWSPVDTIRDVAVADIDRDGHLDFVVSSGGEVDAVGWFENDGTPLDGGWVLHVIPGTLDEANSLAVADFDGDGDPDVAATSALAAGGAVVVALNADGLGTSWTFETVDDAFDAASDVAAGDLDGDGRVDLAGTAFGSELIGGVAWWNRDPTGAWTRHVVAWPVPAAATLALCDIDRDGDLDVAGAAAVSILQGVAWWENGTWTAHWIAPGLGVWSLEAADPDRDGDCDLAWGSVPDDAAGWLENRDGVGLSWTTRPAPGSVEGASGAAAADLDGDGDPDFVAAASGVDDLLAWENRTIHRSALFPDLLGVGFGGACRSLDAGDLDADGDLDLLGGYQDSTDLVWWENLGAGAGWAKWSISEAFSARAVAIADVDGGGLADAVAAGPGGFHHWYHVPGGGWTEYAIPSTLDSPIALLTGDLDRDGDLDLVGAEQIGGLVWLANNRDATDFTESAIATPFLAGGDALALGDLDRDGDLDLVAGLLAGLGWYQNRLAEEEGFAPAASIAAGLDLPRAVAVGDIDGDGDLDVAAVETVAGTVSWWANLAGDGAAWSVARPVAAGIDEPRELLLSDLDLDGDLDLAVGAENGTTHASFVAWYESAGFGASWTAHPIATTALRPTALLAADFDRDGDPDLALGGLAGQPAWWPNRGGQVALATTVTGPLQLPPGVLDDLLAIDVTHRGRVGDAQERLREVALRFTDEALVPLTGDQANALIERLAFYVDDGDGLFEPATEQLLHEYGWLELVDGFESYPLADAPQLDILAGESVRVFVAVELAAGAPAATPSRFRIVHLEATSYVEHRSEGIPLSIEAGDEVAAGLVAVTAEIFSDDFDSGDCAAWSYSTP